MWKNREMKSTLHRIVVFLLLAGATAEVLAQAPEARPTKEQLASDNLLFISLAKKALGWEEPAEPLRIVGPLYFVGTKGLGRHAHIDHAFAFAFFKQQFGAELAVMRDDVAAMESGDKGDFKYAEYYDLEGKRRRAQSEGVRAWVDPEGYRRWVAAKQRVRGRGGRGAGRRRAAGEVTRSSSAAATARSPTACP
jgi:hypothetical protein